MIFLALLAAGIVHAWGEWDLTSPHYDKSCVVDHRAFSGIRIQYGWGVQLYPLEYQERQLLVTKCDGGSIEYEFELPLNATLFNRDIDAPSQNEQLRFVRRKVYRKSHKLSYLPQTLLGVAYSRENREADWKPLSPLVSDHWGTTYWTVVTGDGQGALAIREPLLRSPDVLEKYYPSNDDWAAALLPFEE